MLLARRARRSLATVAALLLAVEFLDEVVFGAREAAWPLIRDDLDLSYAEVGLLLGLPSLASAVLEPAFGILGDGARRRAVVTGGGLAFAAALVLFAGAPTFLVALVGSLLLYPASGAFVSLSQASLVDTNPARAEQLMARWTLAGSLGVVAGPLLIGASVALGAGWRGAMLAGAGVALVLAVASARWHPPPAERGADEDPVEGGLRGALEVVRRRSTWRWLVLLGFSDLVLDVFLAFLALYFVDVAGTGTGTAGLAILVWSVVGLVGDALLLPLLERVAGLRYLRWSARAMLLVFPAFLLAPWLGAKIALLAAIGLLNAGWYSILKAQLYRALPGQSGSVVAVYSAFTSVTGLAPLALGLVAQAWGLEVAMWLLVAGPVALVVGLPAPPRRLSPA